MWENQKFHVLFFASQSEFSCQGTQKLSNTEMWQKSNHDALTPFLEELFPPLPHQHITHAGASKGRKLTPLPISAFPSPTASTTLNHLPQENLRFTEQPLSNTYLPKYRLTIISATALLSETQAVFLKMSKEINTKQASIKGTKKEKGQNKPHQRLFPREVEKDHFCMQFCLVCVAFGLSTRVRWIFPNLHKYLWPLTHTLSFQNPRLWPLLSHSPSSSWQPARETVRAGWKTWSLLQTNYSNLIRSLY